MSSAAASSRAAQLAAAGRGIQAGGRLPEQYGKGTQTVPFGTAREVIRKEIEAQCARCYQKYTLPPGTKNWVCEICHETNTV